MRPYHKLLSLLLLFLAFSGRAQETSPDSANEELVVGVKHSPPFLIEGEEGIQRGVTHDLWVKLAERMDLKYRFRNMELKDMLQALETGEVDVCINPLTVTSQRQERLDFTQPFYISNLAIATHSSNRSELLLFLKNFFSWDFLRVIGLLMAILLIFGILQWWVERSKNPEMFRKGWRGIADGFWWSAVTMTTVGYGDKAPKSGWGKFIGLIWMFTAVIIISGFTATIASSLTIQRSQHNISSLQDLSRVRTGTVEASNSAEFLRSRGIQPKEYATMDKAIEDLASNELEAVLYDEPLLRHSIHEKGLKEDLIVLDQKFEEQHYSFGLPKGSPLLRRMNVELLRILESDTWDRILERYEL